MKKAKIQNWSVRVEKYLGLAKFLKQIDEPLPGSFKCKQDIVNSVHVTGTCMLVRRCVSIEKTTWLFCLVGQSQVCSEYRAKSVREGWTQAAFFLTHRGGKNFLLPRLCRRFLFFSPGCPTPTRSVRYHLQRCTDKAHRRHTQLMFVLHVLRTTAPCSFENH